jgi:hypothetical protein
LRKRVLPIDTGAARRAAGRRPGGRRHTSFNDTGRAAHEGLRHFRRSRGTRRDRAVELHHQTGWYRPGSARRPADNERSSDETITSWGKQT